jgi:hypothetical protein
MRVGAHAIARAGVCVCVSRIRKSANARASV